MKARKRLYILLIFISIITIVISISHFAIRSDAAVDGLYQDVIPFGYGTGGTTASVLVFDMAIDASGNYFFGGRYYGTSVDFDPTAATDIHDSGAVNEVDAFITKINSDGSYGWTRTFGGTDNEWDQVNNVSLDSSGNVYISGTFASASVDFDGTAGDDTILKIGSASNSFITKYLANGDYGWTLTAGSATGALRFNIATADSSGNVYIGGLYTVTQDIDLTAGIENHTAVAVDGFFSRYDTDGNYVWTMINGLSGGNFNYESMEIDSTGNIYTSGWFMGTTDFDPTAGTDPYTANGTAACGFISKYTTAGSYQWTRVLGDNLTSDVVYTMDIAFDGIGNVFVGGDYGFSAVVTDFNGVPGEEDLHSTSGSGDSFLTKYNSDGSYGWTRTFGHSAEQDSSRGLGTNATGDVFMTGWFKSGEEIDFDGTAGVDLHCNGTCPGITSNSGIFFTKYNSDGTYGWTHTIDGSQNYGYEVEVIGSNVYIAGSHYGTTDFDDGPGTAEVAASTEGKGFLLNYLEVEKTAITNLPATLDVEDDTTSLDAEIESAYLNSTDRTIHLNDSTGTRLADIVVDLTAIRDWSTVTAESDTIGGKSFVHNLTSAPGGAATYTLYIPHLGTYSSVVICPNATSLAEVTNTCTNGYQLESSDPSVDQIPVGSQNYWVVTGMSGTGGMEGQLQQQSTTTTTEGTTTAGTTTTGTTTSSTLQSTLGSTTLSALPETGDGLPDTASSEDLLLYLALGGLLLTTGTFIIYLQKAYGRH